MQTRLSKRLFSALLALVMVIVLIPVTVIPALAAEKITITQVNANFNLDRLPKAGDPVIVYSDIISVSAGDVYEVDRSSITWYSNERTGVDANIYYQIFEDINYTGYDKGYCFEAGRTYYMDFTLKIRSQFSQTHSFPRGGLNSDPVNVQFRNLASSEYSVHQVLGWGNTVDICLKFTVDGERTYDDIEIVRAHTWATTSYQPTLPPIRDKYAPGFYCHYNNYTVKSAWEGDFTGVEKDMFVAGNTYKLKLIFTAKSGYKFSEDCKFAFDTNVNIEPDPRLNAEPKSITLKDGRTKLEVEFEFLVEDYKMIETVTLENDLDDPMSFLPVSGAKLKDPYNSLGGAISSDKPYEHTYTVNAYEQRVWRDEKDDPITYAPYEGLQYFTFALVVSDSNQYRFGRNLQVELEGIDSKYYWTEIEFREDDKVVYITFYFVSNYHLEDQQTGATLENSMKCKSYKSLKFALENPGIQYVALSNATDALPFVAPVNVLIEFTEMLQKGASGFQRFCEVMDEQPRIVDDPDAKVLTDVKGSIDFEDVSFSYEDIHEAGPYGSDRVLDHISLHVKAGERLAVVGPSGGGKTTLCSLIPRFYDVTGGSVKVDGQDVRSLTQRSLREVIGIVQQDVYLFAGTIRENIAYGKPDASMEEIEEAARKADLHDFICSLPDGYETFVGERGARLSGGQKQRISIARVFLKDPPILILDEATSSLDNESERYIQESLDRLAAGRTTITIAHRLSTIRGADEIIVLDSSGIKEQGTHRELMEKNGVYAAYYRMQS